MFKRRFKKSNYDGMDVYLNQEVLKSMKQVRRQKFKQDLFDAIYECGAGIVIILSFIILAIITYYK